MNPSSVRTTAEDGVAQEIGRLTTVAELRFLAGSVTWAIAVARGLGLGDDEARQLEHAVDEAVTNVIQHAFGPKDKGTYTIVVSWRPGWVTIRIEDQGLPFDLQAFERGEHTGLGYRLIRGFVDSFRYENLGKRGKRLELVKKLPSKAPGARPAPSKRPVPPDEPVDVRLMRPEEAVGLTRLVYHTYGFSYLEELYYPEVIGDLMERALRVHSVAMNSAGEIVGHLALLRSTGKSRVAESGQAQVDPRYRGRKLYERLLTHSLQQAEELGVQLVFGEAVTVHPHSQRGAAPFGFHPVALLLDVFPEIDMKALDVGNAGKRQALLLAYREVSAGPMREVYAPLHHREMLAQLYEAFDLSRQWREVDGRPSREHSSLSTRGNAEWGHGIIIVNAIGADLEAQTKLHMHQLALDRRLACLYVDVPLWEPAAAWAVQRVEQLGFFFAGVLPEQGDGGDVLRLQYLPGGVGQDLDHIALDTEPARRLLSYISRQPGYPGPPWNDSAAR